MSRMLLEIPDTLHKNLRLRSAIVGRPQYRIVLDAIARYLEVSGPDDVPISLRDSSPQGSTPESTAV